MGTVTRRRLLTGAAAGGAAATLGGALTAPSAAAAADDGTGGAGGGAASPLTITPADPRYPDLSRGKNLRFTGDPEYITLVTDANQVAPALRTAVAAGKRLAVRSGGHCYENFVADPAVQAVIDLSQYNAVGYDPSMRAFCVQAGATLEQVYSALYLGWTRALPGGSCPTVGAGGHIAGGGYGILSRLHGLTVDHLYAVEVVTVGADGEVRTVRATAEPDDPNRDLWWAHTGGGGGNFGVVTRYWLRTAGATGTDPAGLLPAAPTAVLAANLAWDWAGLTEQGFSTLMRNYGNWLEDNSAPDSPGARLFSQLKPQHVVAGSFDLTVEVDATEPGADELLDSFIAAVGAGVGAAPQVEERMRLPWLHATTWPGFTGGQDPTLRFKIKAAYLRRGFTDGQIAAIYHYLTQTEYQNPGSLLLLTSYGGRINAVASDATAAAQRDSILKPQFIASWTDPALDDASIQWVRELYRDVFADTGGVPAPGAATDGCYINYPDVDLGDPAWNTSGVPWYELYYKGNYPALQRAKARWDPGNVFHHAQSVELPE